MAREQLIISLLVLIELTAHLDPSFSRVCVHHFFLLRFSGFAGKTLDKTAVGFPLALFLIHALPLTSSPSLLRSHSLTLFVVKSLSQPAGAFCVGVGLFKN